jgi:hypothetical protein
MCRGGTRRLRGPQGYEAKGRQHPMTETATLHAALEAADQRLSALLGGETAQVGTQEIALMFVGLDMDVPELLSIGRDAVADYSANIIRAAIAAWEALDGGDDDPMEVFAAGARFGSLVDAQTLGAFVIGAAGRDAPPEGHRARGNIRCVSRFSPPPESPTYSAGSRSRSSSSASRRSWPTTHPMKNGQHPARRLRASGGRRELAAALAAVLLEERGDVGTGLGIAEALRLRLAHLLGRYRPALALRPRHRYGMTRRRIIPREATSLSSVTLPAPYFVSMTSSSPGRSGLTPRR